MGWACLKLMAEPPAILERHMRRPAGITREQVPSLINTLSTEATALITAKKQEEEEDKQKNS